MDLDYEAHKKYPGVEIADLQQAALLGLVKGIRCYFSNSLYMLSTVAHYFMVTEINDTRRVLRYSVAFSGRDYSLVTRLIRIQTELERNLCRTPTMQEVVDKNNLIYSPITVERVNNICVGKNLFYQSMLTFRSANVWMGTKNHLTKIH